MKAAMALSEKDPKRVVGLMSGTSIDGVDAAVVEVAGHGPSTRVELVVYQTFPYTPDLRRRLLQVMSGPVHDVCEMNFVLGEVFAAAAKEIIERSGAPVDLVGTHGQTIYHIDRRQGGTPSTLQVGEAAVIAEATGAVVVSDFRVRDIAAGGAGAPLVPYVDALLFSAADRTRALQNIGGIANVTVVPAGNDPEADVFAFDTGPGNSIIDGVTSAMTDGEQGMDEGGRLAARGRVDEALLEMLLGHPFLHEAPPKSTGREVFGHLFAEALLEEWKPERRLDLLRTVTEFTAASIAEAYDRFVRPRTTIDEVLVSGGGLRNETLLESLRRRLAPTPVRSVEEVSPIPSDAKEAVAFAVLANECIHGHPANVPAATGARNPVVLGKISV